MKKLVGEIEWRTGKGDVHIYESVPEMIPQLDFILSTPFPKTLINRFRVKVACWLLPITINRWEYACHWERKELGKDLAEAGIISHKTAKEDYGYEEVKV